MTKRNCVLTIKQLLPGNGWKSVYAVEPDEPGGPIVQSWDILGWALVSHEDCCRDTYFMQAEGRCQQDVIPIGVSDMGTGPIEADGNYLGCVAPGEDIPEWMLDAARKYLDGKAKP